MSNDKPANIAFLEVDRGGRGDSDQADDDITILEEEEDEFDAPPSRAKSSGSAKKGVPKWIFAVGGGIILIALIGGGLMVYSMMNRMSASDEIMPVPPQPISQPEIQPQQGEYGAPQPSSSVLGQEVPVGPGAAMPSAQPTMDAQPSVSRPDAVEVRPLTPAQVPATAQPPVAQQGMGSANNAMMEEQLNKVITGLAALNKRLDEEAARRGKLETEFAALKGRIGELSITSKKASAVVQQPKPVTTPAAPRAAQPKPVRSPQPVHQGDAGVKLSQQTEGVMVAPVVPERVQGWTISSIIGSRAWLIKRNSDGTETELSVAPGERIEGKLVTSVDGASKSVTLEGGQKIGVGK